MAQLKETLSKRELREYQESMELLERLYRIDKSEDDMLFFMFEYFSDLKNPENNAGNIITGDQDIKDAPDFHKELCEILDKVNHEVNSQIGWTAPRGHAKSSYLSNGFPLQQLVFRKRRYIIILSETTSVAKAFMEFISDQLRFNDKLIEDFGRLLEVQKRDNRQDNISSFITKSGSKVEIGGMGTQLRGKKFSSFRPDLVICDDLESQINTNTADLREKNLHWFDSVVMPIGDPERTAFLYMGTVVNENGLLPNIMSRTDFETRKYSAIISPPERQDLWNEFEKKLRDGTADEFYKENQEEMDKGVKVLWEGRYSYKKLMELKANMTSRAFHSEYLNNPTQSDSSIFKEIHYFDSGEYKEVEYRLEFFASWDVAYGRSKRSDYNAIVVLARDRYTNQVYVAHTWARKCVPSVAIEEAIKIIKEFKPKIFAVESVAGQFTLFQQLQRRVVDERLRTHVKAITTNRSHGSKEQRIEQLEPYIKQGKIKLRRTQTRLIEQLELFPSSAHDDLPDALAMAFNEVGVGRRKSWSKKPVGL